jgi:hypothetical protein
MHTQSIDAFRHSHVFLGYRARLFLKNQFPNSSPNSGRLLSCRSQVFV